MIFLLTAPGVPENVQMVIRNDMKDVYLIIRWDPPTFVGGILLNYNVSVISEVRLTLLFNLCSKYSAYKKVIIVANVLVIQERADNWLL